MGVSGRRPAVRRARFCRRPSGCPVAGLFIGFGARWAGRLHLRSRHLRGGPPADGSRATTATFVVTAVLVAQARLAREHAMTAPRVRGFATLAGIAFGFWLAWTRTTNFDQIAGPLLRRRRYLWLMFATGVATAASACRPCAAPRPDAGHPRARLVADGPPAAAPPGRRRAVRDWLGAGWRVPRTDCGAAGTRTVVGPVHAGGPVRRHRAGGRRLGPAAVGRRHRVTLRRSAGARRRRRLRAGAQRMSSTLTPKRSA